MKIKTTDLIGPTLDWAVAQCKFDRQTGTAKGPMLTYAPCRVLYIPEGKRTWYVYTPSTKWTQGGPIIEREGITIQQSPERDCWMAHKDGPAYEGLTPLIAAMRCYVASKLGDEVEVPYALANY
jgi:hypothetical protein